MNLKTTIKKYFGLEKRENVNSISPNIIPEAHAHFSGALFYFNSYGLDAPGLIREFAESDLTPDDNFAINFIGLKTPIEVYPPVLEERRGTVEGPPSPGNWHADIAEWASAFHAVKSSGSTFRIIEVGCGWGCWLANTGLIARRLGKKVSLLGIEADINHLKHADDTLKANGFSSSDYKLTHGIAGGNVGKAIFPNFAAGDAAWGGEAIFSPTEQDLQQAYGDKSKQVLDCYPLKSISDGEIVDLLHIDIQGAEVEFIEGSMEEINSVVRRCLIGTHSRSIEGRLIERFISEGWQLEMERPAITPIEQGKPVNVIDGVQLWSNPRVSEIE